MAIFLADVQHGTICPPTLAKRFSLAQSVDANFPPRRISLHTSINIRGAKLQLWRTPLKYSSTLTITYKLEQESQRGIPMRTLSTLRKMILNETGRYSSANCVITNLSPKPGLHLRFPVWESDATCEESIYKQPRLSSWTRAVVVTVVTPPELTWKVTCADRSTDFDYDHNDNCKLLNDC